MSESTYEGPAEVVSAEGTDNTPADTSDIETGAGQGDDGADEDE